MKIDFVSFQINNFVGDINKICRFVALVLLFVVQILDSVDECRNYRMHKL